VAQGVPGRLGPRIISTFGTARVVGHQPYAPAAFTPGEIPGTHFQRLSQPTVIIIRNPSPAKCKRGDAMKNAAALAERSGTAHRLANYRLH
jgi:hypothetical protein